MIHAAGRSGEARGTEAGCGQGYCRPSRAGFGTTGTKFPIRCYRTSRLEDKRMSILKWALIFLVVSIVAGLLGFTGVSAASADIARVLFYIFVVIFLVLLILGLTIFRA
jgi:uncharacterized membrane protein YtjA (UPF0391 family)